MSKLINQYMKKLFLVLIVAIGLSNCKKLDAPRELPSETSKATKIEFFNEGVTKLPEYEPGVILVKFKDNNNQRAVSKATISTAKYRHNKAMEKSNDNGYYKVSGIKDVKAEIARLKSSGDVVWAEPNYSVQTQAVNDPYYNAEQLWGSFAINQPALWDRGNFGKQSVVCQVIDEPVLACHEDLIGQIYINPNEIPGNLIDDDNNGYIDDINGWNFVNNTPIIYMGASLSHGTHVAGTVAAKRNNGKGIVGVSPHATLLVTPFLGLGGGWIDNATMALDYGTMMKQRGVNVRLSTNSWGGGSASFAFSEALDRAGAADIGFVCAAGNSNQDNDLGDFWPATYSKTKSFVYPVIASDWSNNKASFSSYGKTSTRIAAPGTSILSTVPSSTNTSAYGYKSGTSMATPHVSGAFCLLFAIHPEWTFLQAQEALTASATPIPALTNYCSSGGILNLNASIFWGVTPEVQPDRDCFPVPINTIQPTVPQNFAFAGYGIGPDGLAYMSLTWEASTHPDGIADYSIMLDPNWEWVTFGPSSLSGMPVRDYEIYIRARSTYGIYSDTSLHIRVTEAQLRGVPGDTQPPSVPQNFDIFESGIDANGAWARMRWDWSTDPEGNTISYDIWMVKNTEAARHIGSVGGMNTVKVASLTIANYKFWVVARDSWNNKSQPSNSDTVSFATAPPPPPPPVNDIINPVVNITNPPNGYVIPKRGSKNINIQVSASDNVGVVKIEIWVDGALKNTCNNSTSCNWLWKTGSETSGQHTITAKAFDAAGNVDTESVIVIK